MKRTLKREFKVLEIVKGEAIGIGEGLGGNQPRTACPAARRWEATLKLGSGQVGGPGCTCCWGETRSIWGVLEWLEEGSTLSGVRRPLVLHGVPIRSRCMKQMQRVASFGTGSHAAR